MLALLPTAITVFSLVGYFTYSSIHDVDTTLNKRGNDLSEYLSKISEAGIFSDNIELLERHIKTTANENDIHQITILDQDNKVIASVSRDNKSTINKKP